jgi:hypothetical protein
MTDKTPVSSVRVQRSAPTAVSSRAEAPLPIEEIQEAVAKVRHGTVQLIIQDGRIVQIDTLEKKRLV